MSLNRKPAKKNLYTKAQFKVIRIQLSLNISQFSAGVPWSKENQKNRFENRNKEKSFFHFNVIFFYYHF